MKVGSHRVDTVTYRRDGAATGQESRQTGLIGSQQSESILALKLICTLMRVDFPTQHNATMDQSGYSLTTLIIIGGACGFAGVVIGALAAVIIISKCKGGSDESQNRDALLEHGILKRNDNDVGGKTDGDGAGNDKNPSLQQGTPKTDDMKQMVKALNPLKTELENQTDDVRRQLEDIKKEKDKNKMELEEVKKKLKEKEESYDKPEELVKQQEELMKAGWSLDEKKKILEKQLSDIDGLKDLVFEATRITDLQSSS